MLVANENGHWLCDWRFDVSCAWVSDHVVSLEENFIFDAR